MFDGAYYPEPLPEPPTQRTTSPGMRLAIVIAAGFCIAWAGLLIAVARAQFNG